MLFVLHCTLTIARCPARLRSAVCIRSVGRGPGRAAGWCGGSCRQGRQAVTLFRACK